MTKYFEVVVRLKTETEKGKIKYIRELYLVDAMSVTEAEARVVKLFAGYSQDFEVENVKVSKIIEVVTPTLELKPVVKKQEAADDDPDSDDDFTESD